MPPPARFLTSSALARDNRFVQRQCPASGFGGCRFLPILVKRTRYFHAIFRRQHAGRATHRHATIACGGLQFGNFDIKFPGQVEGAYFRHLSFTPFSIAAHTTCSIATIFHSPTYHPLPTPTPSPYPETHPAKLNDQRKHMLFSDPHLHA